MDPFEPVPSRPQAERPRVVGFDLPIGNDPASVRQRIEAMERMLEGMFEVPVVGRVGLDSIVGLVPVLGDFVTAALGAYIVWEARSIPRSARFRWRATRSTCSSSRTPATSGSSSATSTSTTRRRA